MIKKFSPTASTFALCLPSCSKEPQAEQLERATQEAEATDQQYRTKDFVCRA